MAHLNPNIASRVRRVFVGPVYTGCVKCILEPPLPGRDVCRRCDERPHIDPPGMIAARGRYAREFLAARLERDPREREVDA